MKSKVFHVWDNEFGTYDIMCDLNHGELVYIYETYPTFSEALDRSVKLNYQALNVKFRFDNKETGEVFEIFERTVTKALAYMEKNDINTEGLELIGGHYEEV